MDIRPTASSRSRPASAGRLGVSVCFLVSAFGDARPQPTRSMSRARGLGSRRASARGAAVQPGRVEHALPGRPGLTLQCRALPDRPCGMPGRPGDAGTHPVGPVRRALPALTFGTSVPVTSAASVARLAPLGISPDRRRRPASPSRVDTLWTAIWLPGSRPGPQDARRGASLVLCRAREPGPLAGSPRFPSRAYCLGRGRCLGASDS